jgi:tetratricopeptide (TPR) repeat protein
MKKKLPKTTPVVKDRVIRAKQVQFPSIYRAFPELLIRAGVQNTRLFLINFVCGFTIMGIVVLGLQVRQSYNMLKQAEIQQRHHRAQIKYWENVVAEKPLYRDAYIKLAAMQYMLGERNAAKTMLEKALEIDPRFSVGYVLQQEIDGLL